MRFPSRLGVRIMIYAVIAVATEFTVYGIYMWTGDGTGF